MLLPLFLVLSLLVNGFVAASEPHALLVQGSIAGESHAAEMHAGDHGWTSDAGELVCHEPETTQGTPDCGSEAECAAACATGAGFTSLAAGDLPAVPAALSIAPIGAWLPPDLLPLLRPPRPTA